MATCNFITYKGKTYDRQIAERLLAMHYQVFDVLDNPELSRKSGKSLYQPKHDIPKLNALAKKMREINRSYGATVVHIGAQRKIMISFAPIAEKIVKEEKARQRVDKNKLEANEYINEEGDVVHPDDISDMYQLKTKYPGAPPIAGLDRKVKAWLLKSGIKIHKLAAIKDKAGNPIDAVAKADMLAGIVRLAEGSTETTLSEEAAHFLVELLGEDHPLIKKMMTDIVKRPEYGQVKNEYANVYTRENDFRKEAIGKMIAKEMVTEFKNTPHESWWRTLLNFIKGKFRKLESKEIETEVSPYKLAAKQILEGSTKDLSDIERVKQLAAKGKINDLYDVGPTSTQSATIDKIKATKVRLVDGVYVNEATDAEVGQRVSEYVERFKKSMNVRDFEGDLESPAFIGTTIHAYMEHLIKDKWDNKRTSRANIEAAVAADLEAGGVPVKYHKLGNFAYGRLQEGAEFFVKGVKNNQKRINKANGTQGEAALLTEQVIHSDVHDVAGTADAIVVYSDGSLGIYDFKSFHFKKYARDRNIDPTSAIKMAQWNVQLSHYKKILREDYGVTNFRESRVVPIGTTMYNQDKKTREFSNMDSIDFAYIQTESFKHAALEQIPTAGEMVPDDIKNAANINRGIKKLIALRDSLTAKMSGAKGNERKRLMTELRKLDKSLKALRLKGDISGLMTTALDVVKEVRKGMDVSRATAPGYLTPARIAELMEELNMYDEIVKSTAADVAASIDKIPDLDKFISGKKIKKLGKNASAVIIGSYIQSTKQDLMNIMEDRVSEQAGEDITGTAKNQGVLAKMFYGIAEIDSPIFRRLTQLFTKARDEAEQEVFEAIDLVEGKHKALEEWAKNKGWSTQQAFDYMVDPETKNLMWTTDKQFLVDYKKAKENNDFKWLKDNTKFNVDAYDEALKRFDAFFSDPTFDAISYFNMSKLPKENNAQFRSRAKARVTKERAEFIKRNDVRKHDTAYGTAAPNIVAWQPQDQYENEKYTFMKRSENKALLEYYNMYTDMNENFGKMTSGRIKKNFVANISQDALDRLFELGPVEGISGLYEAFKQSMRIREEDTLLGKTDPNTGEVVRSVPLVFSDDLRIPLTASEKASIEAMVAQEHPEGSKAYKDAVNKASIAKGFEKGRDIKSTDLTKSLILMTRSVHYHDALSNIEGDVKALRYILKEGDVEETLLDENGRHVKSRIAGSLAKRLGVDPDTIATFDDMVDYLLYGRNVKGGNALFGSTISGSKVIQGLHKYISVKALGLNPVLASASYAGAGANLYMMAGEGRMFTQEDLKTASGRLAIGPYGQADRSDEARGFISVLRPASRDLVYEEAEKTSASYASKHFTMRNVFVGHRLGDDNIDNRIGLAMSHSHVIDPHDGLIKHKDRAIGENPKSLFDHVVTKDGKTIVEFNGQDYFKDNSDQFTKFRNKVRKVAFNVKGSTSEEHRARINSTILGQMMMKFRTWMPGLIQARVSGLRYDHTLEQLEMGKFSIFVGELIGSGLKPAIGQIGKLMAGIVRTKWYSGNPNMEYIKQLMDQFYEENPDMKRGDITPEEFMRLYEGKVKSLLIEVRTLLAFIGMLGALGWMDWDDRDENNIFTRTAYLVVNRSLLEISFFLDPRSVMEIVKFPFPVMGVMQTVSSITENALDETRDIAFGENQPNDTTGYGYYSLKALPIANQILALLGYFNPTRFETGAWTMGEEKKKRKKKEDS